MLSRHAYNVWITSKEAACALSLREVQVFWGRICATT